MTRADVANQALGRDRYLTWLTPLHLKGGSLLSLVKPLAAVLPLSSAGLPDEDRSGSQPNTKRLTEVTGGLV